MPKEITFLGTGLILRALYINLISSTKDSKELFALNFTLTDVHGIISLFRLSMYTKNVSRAR